MKDNEVKCETANKTKNIFVSAIKKVSSIAKKTANEVQKSATALSKQSKKSRQEQQLKKYNPLTANEFKSKDFKLPNIIEIVDDAVRRKVAICEGAIGWRDEQKGVEILHLYDEFVEESGLVFVPVARCDNVYCVDNFNRNQFVNTSYIFGKTNEEKLAELARIAHSLGAKKCSIEILESSKESNSASTAIKSSDKEEMCLQSTAELQNVSKSSGKRILCFDGSVKPVKPELKWFAHDDNIKGLIDMRCSENNSIKATTLELDGACSTTMSRKTACAVDKLLKISGKFSMENQVSKELSSKLVFEIEF